jgi:hypothetical protein
LTVPPKILKDLVNSFQRRPIVYVLDVPGYQFGEAMISPAGPRVVAMSHDLYHRVDYDIRMRSKERLDDLADVRHSPIAMSGGFLQIPVRDRDGMSEFSLSFGDIA